MHSKAWNSITMKIKTKAAECQLRY